MKLSGFALIAAAIAGSAGFTVRPIEAAPVAIAVIDFDYLDSSGEPSDQRAAHKARLADFMRALRADLSADGNFRVVAIACSDPPCTAARTPPTDLIARAKAAGAGLLLFGQIHKMSTLVEWANTEIVDLAADKLIESKLFTFRGDTDEAWRRAEKFVAQETRGLGSKL